MCIYLGFLAALFGALSWLFRDVFPLPQWAKTTGFIIFLILCIYEVVRLVFCLAV